MYTIMINEKEISQIVYCHFCKEKVEALFSQPAGRCCTLVFLFAQGGKPAGCVNDSPQYSCGSGHLTCYFHVEQLNISY